MIDRISWAAVLSVVAVLLGGALIVIGPDGYRDWGFYSGLVGIYLAVLSLREEPRDRRKVR